mmetsp:Transcript_69934/g.221570  ORF Transcript_69934/g.221570 Transcript_69934/m.221570 type:complete len:373 (-) Transcript_69934:316-1434(-)
MNKTSDLQFHWGLGYFIRQSATDLGHVGALGKVVVVVGLDLVENAPVDNERRPHGPPGVVLEAVDPLLSHGEVVARAVDLVLHEGAPPIVHLPRGGRVQPPHHLLLRNVELAEVLQRHVDAVALRVLPHVPQNVCELVGSAQSQRRLVDWLRGSFVVLAHPHHWHAHQPDGPRHTVAVLVELVEGLVAGLDKVHAHAVDHVAEWLDVQGKARHSVGERSVEDVVRPPVEDGLEALLPAVERVGGDARGVGAVDELVRAPAPHVDGPDGVGLLLGHQLRPEVKGLGILSRHNAAALVRILERLLVVAGDGNVPTRLEEGGLCKHLDGLRGRKVLDLLSFPEREVEVALIHHGRGAHSRAPSPGALLGLGLDEG